MTRLDYLGIGPHRVASSRLMTLKEEKYAVLPPSDFFPLSAVEVFESVIITLSMTVSFDRLLGMLSTTGGPLSVLITHFCQRI